MIYCRQGRTRFYGAIAWCRVVANNVKEAKNNRSKPQNRDRELLEVECLHQIYLNKL